MLAISSRVIRREKRETWEEIVKKEVGMTDRGKIADRNTKEK